VLGRRLVNGVESTGVAVDDRGLQYGDGLFETMAAVDGRIRHFGLHLARLDEGCRRLRIPVPAADQLEHECSRVLEGLGAATVKLIVTRGPGPRGYRPPAEPSVSRIVMSSAARPRSEHTAITVRICETRLGQNRLLAGLKHLNRLEQVMACSEWDDPAIAEGLMLSMDGRLICATAANLFLVRGGCLVTPDVRDCGVAGVMRRLVLDIAARIDIPARVEDLRPESLGQADEVFLTNAVAGIRPVGEILGTGRWAAGGVTRALAAAAAMEDA